jgi:hypothetical protein
VNIIRLTTSNTIDIGTTFAAHLSVADIAPTSQFHLTPKGYVDLINTGHIASTNPHAAAKYAAGDYSYLIEYREATPVGATATIPLQNVYNGLSYAVSPQNPYNAAAQYTWKMVSQGEAHVIMRAVDESGTNDYTTPTTLKATIIGLKP